MSKILSILLVLLLLIQLMPVRANENLATPNTTPEGNEDGKGFNWTLAFIITSIISFILAVIIAMKQANKRFPEE